MDVFVEELGALFNSTQKIIANLVPSDFYAVLQTSFWRER